MAQKAVLTDVSPAVRDGLLAISLLFTGGETLSDDGHRTLQDVHDVIKAAEARGEMVAEIWALYHALRSVLLLREAFYRQTVMAVAGISIVRQSAMKCIAEAKQHGHSVDSLEKEVNIIMAHAYRKDAEMALSHLEHYASGFSTEYTDPVFLIKDAAVRIAACGKELVQDLEERFSALKQKAYEHWISVKLKALRAFRTDCQKEYVNPEARIEAAWLAIKTAEADGADAGCFLPALLLLQDDVRYGSSRAC